MVVAQGVVNDNDSSMPWVQKDRYWQMKSRSCRDMHYELSNKSYMLLFPVAEKCLTSSSPISADPPHSIETLSKSHWVTIMLSFCLDNHKRNLGKRVRLHKVSDPLLPPRMDRTRTRRPATVGVGHPSCPTIFPFSKTQNAERS